MLAHEYGRKKMARQYKSSVDTKSKDHPKTADPPKPPKKAPKRPVSERNHPKPAKPCPKQPQTTRNNPILVILPCFGSFS